MLFEVVKMLKKKLGAEAIEMDWGSERDIENYFKIPSTLIIPENCEKTGFAVFTSCNKILKEVIFPDGCKEIGDSAFMYCEKLEKVVISGSVERICNSAFYGCENAEIILKKLEKDFEKIGPYAFEYCKNVKEETRN